MLWAFEQAIIIHGLPLKVVLISEICRTATATRILALFNALHT